MSAQLLADELERAAVTKLESLPDGKIAIHYMVPQDVYLRVVAALRTQGAPVEIRSNCPNCHSTGKVMVTSFVDSTKKIPNSCHVCNMGAPMPSRSATSTWPAIGRLWRHWMTRRNAASTSARNMAGLDSSRIAASAKPSPPCRRRNREQRL